MLIHICQHRSAGFWLLFAGLFLLASWVAAPSAVTVQPSVNRYIAVDQFGYRPGDVKAAVIVDPQAGPNADDAFEPGGTYEVRRWSDGSVAYSGTLATWNSGAADEQAGDRGWWFDFTDLAEEGSYYVYDVDRDVRSHRFAIQEDVYAGVLKAAMRTFFYQRVNFAKECPYADSAWTDGAAFERSDQDPAARSANDQDNPATERDMRGGWFDAGDYNKYVTFATEAVHPLLTAYRLNPEAFGDDFNIPESGNGLPDLIDELKYEMDWLKRMQDDDGGVFIKIGSLDFDGQSPPSSDTRPRFYEQKCSSSSIAAAGMFAHAAVVFGPFAELQDYAADLTGRAEQAWNWYQTNDRSDQCDPQTVKAGDADWTLEKQDGAAAAAAAYLFAATGKDVYDDYVQTYYTATQPWRDDTFARYNRDQGGAMLYYTTLPSADDPTKTAILAKLASQARTSHAYGDNASALYRAYMPNDQYHWGSNAVTSGYGHTNMLVVAYGQDDGDPEPFRTRALDHLHYLHGVNPQQRVYLSNMYPYGAEETVNEMYHRWFNDGTQWDNVTTSLGPAPGYVVGGPNKNYGGSALPSTDGACSYPPMKCYADTNDGGTEPWSLTEPAIYYQAIYVLLLSYFVDGGVMNPLPANAPPAAPTDTSGTTPDSPDVALGSTAEAPTVDGERDEAYGDATYTIGTDLIGSDSGDDFSASWSATWDDTALYLFVDVQDDTQVNDSENAWEDDAVEVYIDADNSKGTSYDGTNDAQYVFRWDDTAVNVGGAFPDATTDVTFAMPEADDGYHFEVAFPWSTLGVTPAEGSLVGLDVHVIDDDDGDGREAKKSWMAASDNAWQNPSLFGTIELATSASPTAAEGTSAAVPEDFVLEAAYPNPFNPQTTIGYALPRAADVRLAVYDVLGRQVALLAEGFRPAGRHEAVFDGAGLASGLYFYRLEAQTSSERFAETRQVALVK